MINNKQSNHLLKHQLRLHSGSGPSLKKNQLRLHSYFRKSLRLPRSPLRHSGSCTPLIATSNQKKHVILWPDQ